jgi:2-hydroxy-3-keto-5-methylthiopentenyl-1-phosphate phosphatase
MRKQQIQIFCDFDGTITNGDTVDLLLETLADDQWKAIEERWVKGEIGSRECMALQVPLIRGGWDAMLQVLDTVKVDRSFATFVQWCRLRHIPIAIVSDGIDRVIKHILKRENIKLDNVWANHLVETADGKLGLQFPKNDHRVVCPSGLCKCQVLDKAGPQPLKVVIGDGRSDFCWANNADLLFAKDKLLAHCNKNNIAHVPYDNFVQIRVLLEEMMATDAQPSFLGKSFMDVALLANS